MRARSCAGRSRSRSSCRPGANGVLAAAYVAQSPPLRDPSDLPAHVCLTHGATENTEWYFEKDGQLVGQKIPQRLSVDSYVALLQYALHGTGIIRIRRNVVRAHLADGRLLNLMPDYRCVQAHGDTPAMWLIYPNRQLSYRMRTFVTAVREYLDRI